jgi:hypothetical protein
VRFELRRLYSIRDRARNSYPSGAIPPALCGAHFARLTWNDANRRAWQRRTAAVHRIVSLLPSSIEIVCALDFEDQLVGGSRECDFFLTVTRVIEPLEILAEILRPELFRLGQEGTGWRRT